jgi:hypothetical protein
MDWHLFECGGTNLNSSTGLDQSGVQFTGPICRSPTLSAFAFAFANAEDQNLCVTSLEQSKGRGSENSVPDSAHEYRQ